MSSKSRVHRRKRRSKNKKINQKGGFLGSLIAGAIIAKAKKKKFNAKKHLSKWWNQRKAVTGKLLNQEIPTPGNTGMSTRQFWTQALGGIAI